MVRRPSRSARVAFALCLLAAFVIADGRPALGIGAVVAAFILPQPLMLPFRIRESRRRAAAARARREAASGH